MTDDTPTYADQCEAYIAELREQNVALRADVQRLTEERDNWQTAYYEEGRRISNELRIDLAAARQRIEHLEAALRWYGEKAKHCGKTTSDGDEARQALACDYGEMADRALSPTTDDQEQSDAD